jgi:hypothetical protein
MIEVQRNIGMKKEVTSPSRYFQSHHPYYPYDPYLYRQDLIPELRMTITIAQSGKNGKDRKHLRILQLK